MVGIVQIFVLLLILVSFAMVVAVPVILATPGEWEKSQGIVWRVLVYGLHWLSLQEFLMLYQRNQFITIQG